MNDMDLEPYGWHSPEQIAARAAQLIELWGTRRDLRIAPGVTRAIRWVVDRSLRSVMRFQQLDRAVLELVARSR